MTLNDQHSPGSASSRTSSAGSAEETSLASRAYDALHNLYDGLHDGLFGEDPAPAAARGHQRAGRYSGQLSDGGGAFTLSFRTVGTQVFGSYVAPSGHRYTLEGRMHGPDGFTFKTKDAAVHVEISGSFAGDTMNGTLKNPKPEYASAFSAQPQVQPKKARPASASVSAPAGTAAEAAGRRTPGPAGRQATSTPLSTEQKAALTKRYPDADFEVKRGDTGAGSKQERHRVFRVIVAAARDLGEPFPEVLAAQWALESTWGKSPSGKNNLFGIKARKGEASTLVNTHEQDGQGKGHAEKDAFRDYDSVIEGVQARVELTRRNPAYARHGYFRATTCREALQALKDAGYATDKGYVDSLVGVLKGVGIDADQVTRPASPDAPAAQAHDAQAPQAELQATRRQPRLTPAAPTVPVQPATQPQAQSRSQGPRPQESRPQAAASPMTVAQIPATPASSAQSSVTPTPVIPAPVAPDTSAEAVAAMEHAPADLAELMAKQELKPEEIAQARALIEAVESRNEREDLYLDLQRKVPYHNQRNNASKEHGEAIGDSMCNLTTLAMALETLGVGNPDPEHFPQFEDYLESLRVKRKLPARTDMAGWGGVARAMGATYQIIGGDVVKGASGKYEQSWWQQHVLPALKAGKAVTMSIGGHIVRVQDVTDEGLTVDDPYGISRLKAGKARGWKGHNAKTDPSAPETQDAVGADVHWDWTEVSGHVMHWIVTLSK